MIFIEFMPRRCKLARMFMVSSTKLFSNIEYNVLIYQRNKIFAEEFRRLQVHDNN